MIGLQKEPGYTGYLLKEETSLEDFTKLAVVNENGAYSFMVKNLLPEVIGKTTWKMNSMYKKISTFSNLLDEAFCLVCLENYWDRWWDEVKYKHQEGF